MDWQEKHLGVRVRSFGWKILVLAVILILSAATLPACASPEETSSPGEDGRPSPEAAKPTPIAEVRVAYRNTAEAETARMAATMTFSGLPADPNSPPGMDMSEMRMTMNGVTDFAGEEARYIMEMPLFGRVEVRQVGGIVYQKFPEELMAEASGGATWVRTDLDEAMREEFGMSLSQMQSGTPTDMTGQLEYLKSVSDSVERVGEEEVRGAPTTHYRADIDLGKEAERIPQMRETYDELIRQIGTDTIPAEVWLDEGGMVRRFTMTMPIVAPPDVEGMEEAPPLPEGAEFTMVQELYDFGAPVSVAAPPEEDTVDLDELISEQNAGTVPAV